MHGEGPLDAVPLWGFGLFTLVLVFGAVEGGYRLGRARWKRSDLEKEAPVGAMVGASLGLLAFLLAFTFGQAAERHENRKLLLVDEANAIGTTYLRAGTLPERRAEIRALLREYVEARLQGMQIQSAAEGLRRSERLHERLWEEANGVGLRNPSSIVVGLFIQSLNEVIDLHAKRLFADVRNRIPGVIWAALLVIAFFSLGAMGYHAGISGTIRSLSQLAVAFSFAVVIALIADLDRPLAGTLTVSPRALIDLRQSMSAP
jgi:hypothetical protein